MAELHWGELFRAFGLFELIPVTLVSMAFVGYISGYTRWDCSLSA
jgi:hypothetical protein